VHNGSVISLVFTLALAVAGRRTGVPPAFSAARRARSALRSASHFAHRMRSEVTSVGSSVGVNVVLQFSQIAIACP